MSEISVKPVREERQPARDEIDEVAPGILRIQLPISFPGLGHVNCYAMEDDRGFTLVDPGLPGIKTWRQLKKRLATVGIPIERVHTVVVTHSHPDHFGQVARFKKANNAEIITHRSFRTFLDPEAEADEDDVATVFETGEAVGHHHHGEMAGGCRHGDPTGLPAPAGRDGPMAVTPWGGKPYELPLSRRIGYAMMRLAAGRFMATPRPTRRVEDADVLRIGGREWISVHTPGHTRDHLCLWEPNEGVLISGDHVLPTITPHISGLSDSLDPLSQFFESLDRMKTFSGVTAVLPAHGLTFTDLAGRADSISEHHRDRLETLREAGDTVGRGTVADYMQRLFQERSWGPMAESETYAHLVHLKLRNEAAVSHDGEQLRFEILG